MSVEPDEEALAAVARLRGRFHGALLGLALGEALAAPALYGRPGAFRPVRDLLGGGPLDLPRGAWSAHAALALGAARSLLVVGRCDPDDQRERWRRWQRLGEGSATGECLGISSSVARALVEGVPDRSIADGADALTRVAPFALRHLADPVAMQQAVRDSAAVTCHEPATFTAAAGFAAMMHAALRGADPATVLAAGGPPRCGAVLPGTPAGAGPGTVPVGARPELLLALAVQSFAAGGGWKDMVLRAVNLGGPADALGALCGQLAGACLGVGALPTAWLGSLVERRAIVELADGLLAEALVGLADAA